MNTELTQKQLTEIYIQDNKVNIAKARQTISDLNGVVEAWVQMGNTKQALARLEDIKFQIVMIGRYEENLQILGVLAND
jgi:hypothetical protein